MPLDPSSAARFWAKVEKTDGCWHWTAATSAAGYGVFCIHKPLTGLAHRIAYEELVGPIPDGLQLDHLCRVRHCVNPAHLEPVTGGENVRRAVAVRQVRTHCGAGHPLTTDNVIRSGSRIKCKACHRAVSYAWWRRNRVSA